MKPKTYREYLLEHRSDLAKDGIIVKADGSIKPIIITKPKEAKIPWMKKKWSTFN